MTEQTCPKCRELEAQLVAAKADMILLRGDLDNQRQLRTAAERERDKVAATNSAWHAAFERAGIKNVVTELTASLAVAQQQRDEAVAELERWAAVSSERNHGASGLCCQLRLHEKQRAEAALARVAELERERDEARR